METTATPRSLLQKWFQKPLSSSLEADNEETLYIKSIPGAEESILEGLEIPISDLHEIEVTKEFLGID